MKCEGADAAGAGMPTKSPLEFHPFLADRFAEAVVPACALLVVDHDPRPLERFLDRVAKSDGKWLEVEKARAAIEAAARAVAPLPKGEPPEDLIASHQLVYDPHTKREVVLRPPPWATALNEVAAADDLTPGGKDWYGKLSGGMVAWIQGGRVRGWLARAEVPVLRQALDANPAMILKWKEKGGDFHRRKVQAFCYIAEKHGVGLAGVVR